MVSLALEVLLPEDRRHFFELFLLGSSLACLGQRLLVDIGGVDLGPLPIL